MSPTSRRVAATLATALLAGLAALGACPAGAESDAGVPGSGPLRVLADHGWHPAAVAGPGGTVTVLWADDVVRGPIRAVDHVAGTGWGEPAVIGRGSNPVVAVDTAGNLTAVWNTNRRGSTTGVATAYRPAGGAWQPAERLSVDAGVPGYDPYTEDTFGAGRVDLAVSADGAAVAVWHWGSFARERPLRVQAVHRPGGGEWGTPVDVTDADWSGEPRVAVDAAGAAVVVYAGHLAGPGSPVLARTSTPEGDWSPAVTLSRRAFPHQVACDGAGNAVALFHQRYTRVRAAYLPAGGGWQPAVDLSPRGVAIEEAQLRMEQGGTATVVWSRSSGRVDVISRPAGGEWRRPTMLAGAAEGGYGPALAVNDRGVRFAAWGTWDLTGRYRDPVDGWSGLLRVSRRDSYVADRLAVIDTGGDVLVVWLGGEHTLMARWLRLHEPTSTGRP